MRPPIIRTMSNCRVVRAGEAWNVIRVPRSVGLDALAILGARSGAVLEDPLAAALYWLVSLEDATTWDVAGTRVLDEDADLVVPPAGRTQGPGPYWRVRPTAEVWTTEATALQAALEDATRPRAKQVQ